MLLGCNRVAMSSGEEYDREVEYLQSDGASWIDTNFIPDGNCSYYIEFFYSSQYPPYNAEVVPIGTWDDWKVNMWGDDFKQGGIGFCYGVSDYGWQLTLYYPDLVVNSSKILGTYTNSGSIWKGSNGNIQVSSHSPQLFSCSQPAFLFSLNFNGSSDFKFPIRIFCVKIFDADNKLVRDFIPVVKDNVGYLYDKCGSICPLTGTSLYANAGTGSFTWGELNSQSVGGGVIENQ